MRISDRLSLAYAYGTSLVSYLVDGVPRPFSASFAVTNRCNIHCSYCSCPSLNDSELDLEKIDLLFSRLHALGVRRLGLAGGEPLVREDFGEVVRLAKKWGFFVTLNSNLMLYRADPSRLDEVDLVFTSLDGDAQTHRINRGPKSYDGVIESITELIRRGKPVVAICVVTESNLGQAPYLLQQAEALGFRVHFQPQCTNTAIVRGDIPETATNEMLRIFWRDLLQEKRRGRPVASSEAYLEFLSRWKDFRVSSYYDPAQTCAAGRGFLYVDHAGDAYPCAYTKGKAPPISLLTEDWRSAFTKKTPCTDCSVGPMLEFNLLFRRPLASSLGALRTYGE